MTTKLAYSIADAVTVTSLSRRHLLAAIAAGELKARKSSVDKKGEPVGKWVVLHSDLAAYLEGLPTA